MLQHRGVLRVLVAHLAPLEAGERHFGDALLEGVAATELGKVVIRPGDGRDGETDRFFFHDMLLWSERRPRRANCPRGGRARSQNLRADSASLFILRAASTTAGFSDTCAVPTRHQDS